MRLGKQRKAALCDVVHPVGWNRIFDGVQVIVEADTEVGIVPPDSRPFHLGEQEPQIGPQPIETQRLVIDHRVDAEAAGVRATEASYDRHDLDRRRLCQSRCDELPPLFDGR